MTDWKSSYKHLVKRIFVQREVDGLPAVERSKRFFNDIEFTIIDQENDIPVEHQTGTTLYLRSHRGEAVGQCPGSAGHLCCNYLTVDLYTGCGLGCTYCIMRSYLNFSPVSVYVDPNPSIDLITSRAVEDADRPLRVGTGETGDSLLFDPIFDLSREFIRGLSRMENVFFEMKTKTDLVDHLLEIPEKGNAVIGFSLNPDEICESEEGISSPVASRLSSSHRVVESGFLTSFHFDPVFKRDDWRELYLPLIDRLADFPTERIAWISIGTFRYPPRLKEKIPQRPYLYDEFFPSKDGKYRYQQRIRVEMYRELVDRIRSVTGAPVYLCMESEAVWRKVYGRLPDEIPYLSDIFDDGLPRR